MKESSEQQYIITFNAGSSTIKFALFNNADLSCEFHKQIDLSPNHSNLTDLINQIGLELKNYNIIAAGHRVVHGGKEFADLIRITPEILNKLKALIPLAPLHQPYNVQVIQACLKLYPNITQIACFDTAFHRSRGKLEQIFALPDKYRQEGIIPYGFHGLSYQYIASILPEYAKSKAKGKVIVAHLGNGASICAMKGLQSMATSMGFTALDGLMMGTRCGSLDPGVILYLLEEKKMTVNEVKELLYHQSGLKAVSNISHDIRTLLQSSEEKAQEAIELFCYKAAKHIAGLIPTINGLEAIVFTAGIGENSPVIREKICQYLSWLGITIDIQSNKNNKTKISTNNSKIEVYVLKTDEEKIIAKQTKSLLKAT